MTSMSNLTNIGTLGLDIACTTIKGLPVLQLCKEYGLRLV